MSADQQCQPDNPVKDSSKEGPVFKSQFKKQKIDNTSSSNGGIPVDDKQSGYSAEEEGDEDYDSGSDCSEYYDCENEDVKTEIQLGEVESILMVWKNGKTKITETLKESEKLLLEVRNTLVDASDVGKTIIDKLEDITCSLDDILNEIQEVKDKSSQKTISLVQDHAVQLRGLEYASSIVQKQCEIWTKLTFRETKRLKGLTERSEDHERRILELIASQKERLIYYDEMITSAELDRAIILKKMNNHPNQLVVEKQLMVGVGSGEENLNRKRNFGAV